jgi:hypothetical protein
MMNEHYQLWGPPGRRYSLTLTVCSLLERRKNSRPNLKSFFKHLRAIQVRLFNHTTANN